ncbi:somatoliberin isoform X1 [Polypterus senegalus]|uniref:somatoliberin isoform X1 n=1 Tax=Polypterus senegalus TaxID=55291 RepID=UPI001962BCE3|nr:somatoliberin isoform X1 [Polypterus senegalus]
MLFEKGALLVFCCLTAHTIGSPLHPALRYDHKAASSSSFTVRFLAEEFSCFPSTDWSSRQIPTAQRAERHADAIFTNSYRKVLGQISARKFLQTIMGKRTGSGNTEDSRHLDKQQNGLHTDGRRHYYSTFLGQTSGSSDSLTT